MTSDGRLTHFCAYRTRTYKRNPSPPFVKTAWKVSTVILNVVVQNIRGKNYSHHHHVAVAIITTTNSVTAAVAGLFLFE